MVRLNVSLICETSENSKKLAEVATELVAFSLRDKGCVDYDFYQSRTNDDRFLIVETWESAEDLKAHSETDHYKRLAPRLRDYANVTVEKFDF
ncbi:MAG: antibiotic biosynthesis monooxygenase [Muribaculaceae bacterium]|nr:antibiotic biosynthesis monooxygenase [Muribaculaceae bacterium]